MKKPNLILIPLILFLPLSVFAKSNAELRYVSLDEANEYAARSALHTMGHLVALGSQAQAKVPGAKCEALSGPEKTVPTGSVLQGKGSAGSPHAANLN